MRCAKGLVPRVPFVAMWRRLLIFIGCLVAVVVLVAITVPWWLDAALQAAGDSRGLTFGRYERLGYARFELHNLKVQREGWQIAVSRIEGPTPLVWAWCHLWNQGAEVIVDRWSVTLTAAKSATEPAAAGESGWIPVRRQALDLVETVNAWIAHARIGPGVVHRPAGDIAVGSVAWADRTLNVQGVEFGGRNFDATVALPAGSDVLRVVARERGAPNAIELESRGPDVSGTLTWEEQRAQFAARFAGRGWRPQTANIRAENWSVPAARLKLGDSYSQVQGSARVDWTDGHFVADLNARGDTPPGQTTPPPLAVTLRAHGTPERVTIDALDATLPGGAATLSEPLTVSRDGKVEGNAARFVLHADLADQPWFPARGVLDGAATVSAPGATPPVVTFEFTARDVEASGVAVAAGELRGTLSWPRLEVTGGTLVGAAGDRLEWRGGWDFQEKAILPASVEGRILRSTLARWIPDAIKFEAISIEASGSGPPSDANHAGSVRVDSLELPNTKPMAIVVEWRGHGLAAEALDARILAGNTAVRLGGSASASAAQLTTLEFARGGDVLLRLGQPASVQWKPAPQVSLQLTGPAARLVAGLHWGAMGNVQLAAQGISSDWFEDLVTVPQRAIHLELLAITGSWDRGPMTFEITVGGSAKLPGERQGTLYLAARGDGDGLRLDALRVLAGGETVVNAAGRLPLTLTPGGGTLVHIKPEGAVAWDASVVPDSAVWDQLAELAGIELKLPRAELHVRGTWAQPEGSVELAAARVAIAPGKIARHFPPVDDFELRLTGNRSQAVLERLTARVEGQLIQASARVPAPRGGWQTLASDPLAALSPDAEGRLEIPSAEIAAFRDFLPGMIAPAGTLEIDAAWRDGALAGRVQLHGASTRPLGSLGILQNINADIALAGRAIEVRNASAQSGGQTLALTGRIELPEGGDPRFNLTARGRDLPFVRQVGLLVRGDIDLSLKSPAGAGPPTIAGTVRLHDSLFLRDVRAVLPQGGAAAGPSRRPPFFSVPNPPFNAWRLAVQIEGNDFLRLRTPVFNGDASARFTLGGTLGEPQAVGNVTIESGEVLMPFANFDVQQGTVRLTRQNPYTPDIYVRATTRKYGYDLAMEVKGTASAPAVTFTSSPPLAADQVLLMVTAGVVPSNEIGYSQTQRAARIGAFLGKSLLGNLGANSAGAERLTIESGEDISRQGKETYRISYELSGRWTATGEYNKFDEYNGGVRWRLLPREESATDSSRAKENEKPPQRQDAATLEVNGGGWLRNRELKASLQRLLETDTRTTLDANALEDAAVILLSSLGQEGFQEPALEIVATRPDGTEQRFDFDPTFATPLPRALEAKRVEFVVTPGLRWHVTAVHLAGLTALPEDRGRAYFRTDETLLARAKTNAYSPSAVKRGAENLRGELQRLGYVEAEVNAEVTGETGGNVTLAVNVNEGAKWIVEAVRYPGTGDADVTLTPPETWVGQPLDSSLDQDLRESVRQAYFEAGYPDIAVQVEVKKTNRAGREVAAELVVTIEPGEHITVGDIRFTGNDRTKESVLRRRVALETGDPLNPLAFEQARFRLARLGVFDSVELHYEPDTGPTRDPVFTFTESRPFHASLLAGYGSYEQFRIGVEARQSNLFGRAHQSRLNLVQSMKSTSFDLDYSVPALLGETLDGTANLYALRRQEIAFLREESGASVALRREIAWFGGDATVRYTYEALRNSRNELLAQPTDASQINVASVSLALRGDRRDNPLRPRHGYNWLARVEGAAPWLGGASTYQRLELSAGYHTGFGAGRWIHVGLSHGVITTYNGNDATLPVNRRFYPGGDTSIRGYRNGEAAPREPDGRYLGAKSTLLLNVEIEQALTPSWSAVAFVDALAATATLRDYPLGSRLYSVGLGVNYQTLIGPIRLEYGHNLNPRPRDPAGTWQISIGFPF